MVRNALLAAHLKDLRSAPTEGPGSSLPDVSVLIGLVKACSHNIPPVEYNIE